MRKIMMTSRRGFLKTIFSAGALILCAKMIPEISCDAIGAPEKRYSSVYLGIEPNGTVIIVAHRSEMGTGIRTALPMVAADELDADWKLVRIEQAIGDPKYGEQNTDGSRSIRDFYDTFREAGATARLLLERAAAAKWGVPVTTCYAKNHRVVHKSGQTLAYGELAPLAAKLPVPAKKELRFKSPAEFRYIGKGVPFVDLDDMCTGKAIYGIDAKMPDMVCASIERSPVLGGALESYDDAETLAVKGVQKTVVIKAARPPYAFKALGGVAVMADNTWAAMQGRRKLKVSWKDSSENGAYTSESYKKSLLEVARSPQKVVRNIGDVDAEFARAHKTYEAEYYVPHLAHVPMEPPAAVAEFRDGKVVVWAATQNPQAVQSAVAGALKIDKKDVICHVTLLGGGFGRKSKPDYIVEAAILSKEVGRPVKIVWSREEDIQFDYYHTVAAMYMKAATDKKGRPTAWLQRSVFPPIPSTFDTSQRYGDDFELAQGLVDIPFDIPNLRAENGPAKNHVRIGWLRSVANIYHAFAVQSFIDELAAAVGRDPVEYFLDVLGDSRIIDFDAEGTVNVNYGKPLALYPFETGRLRRVIEIVAEQSGWMGRKGSKGTAMGFAAHRSFLSCVAVVVRIEVDDKGHIRIPRVDVAVDAGRIIHPERVKAQFEGAAVFGATIALMGEITAAGGRILQSNFNDCPVARFTEAPYETHVHLVPSDDLPAGVGEPGVPPIAPALANALFAATQIRLRTLPMKQSIVLKALKERSQAYEKEKK